MSEPAARMPAAEGPPRLAVADRVQIGAGTTATVAVTVTNTADQPRVMAVTVLGLDSDWVPRPVRTDPIAPGHSLDVLLPLSPASGAVPATYPCAIAVQALDPVTGRAMSAPELAELALTVSAPGQVGIEIQPSTSTSVASKRLVVQVSNRGSTPASVRLEALSSSRAPLRLSASTMDVAPGETVRVGGRIRVRRPRLFGQRARHAFTVTALSAGAPRTAQGSFTAKPLFGSTGAKAIAMVAIVALWAGLAVVFIPRLADQVKTKQEARSAALAGQSSNGGAGGAAGSGGQAGGNATAGGGKVKPPAKPAASGVQFNGVVAADEPSGVTVSMKSTSLVDENAANAVPIGVSGGRGMMGRIPATAVHVSTKAAGGDKRSTLTRQDGAWAFPRVASPGFYLLTFAKPGYQTQRYILDAASAAAVEPLKVTLVAGQGHLSGHIRGPSGAVGGAQVTITDGTNTVTTSTNSTGAIGDWSVDGLSTPSTYVVTVSKPGLGAESAQVSLAAGGSDQVNMTLKAGVGSVVGTISAEDDLGVMGGLGGAEVTATDGTVTRSATTVTSGPVGKFTLSDLPTPGTYTVTVAAPGYQPQTSTVSLKAGQSWADLSTTLTPDSAIITGTISVQSESGETGAGLVGVGLVLSNEDNTYKTMTTSQPAGAFRFSGVAPGTYVLSSQLFGYTTDYVTVEAVAGQTTEINRGLTALAGGVLPATSHIRGEVVDARTGGPVTCPKDNDKCLTATVEDPRTTDAAGKPTTFTTTFLPTEQYTLPETTSTDGLLPGLHIVHISAPGYEPATVRVEVPLGAMVTAPRVALQPAPVITGRITAVIGAPTGPTCVWAVPAGSATTSVDCPTTTTPTTCNDATTDPTVSVCALVGTDGSYRLQVPVHGGYRVYVKPSDTEYVGPAVPASFTLPVGGTQQYDVLLHRLARVSVLVLEPSPSGVLQAAGGVSISVDGVLQPAQTGPSGTVLITGLTPGVHQLTASKPRPGGGDPITAGPVPIGVTYDQTYPATLTLTNPISAVIGQLTVNVDGKAIPIAGASVTLTGVQQYVGTLPVNGSVVMTTGKDGCFAAYPGATAPTSWPSACTDIANHVGDAPDQAARPFTLLSDIVSVSATASGYSALNVSQTKVTTGSTVNIFTMRPDPVAFTGTLGVSPNVAPDNSNLSNTSVRVVSGAPGSGVLTASVSDTGAVSINDASMGAANQLYPGTYTLEFTRTGYSSRPSTFTCKVAEPCTMSATLVKLSGLTIMVQNSSGTAVNGARLILTDTTNATPAQTVNAPGDSATFTGLVADSPGRYKVTVQAGGYRFGDAGGTDVTLSCGGATATVIPGVPPGGSVTCTVALTRIGAVSGTVNGIIAASPATDPHEPISGATVTVRQCKTAVDPTKATTCTTQNPTFTATSAKDGTYRVTGTSTVEGLAAGTWQVTTTAPGFADATSLVTVTDDADAVVDPSLYITPVSYTVTVRDGNGTGLSGLTLKLLDGPSSPATAKGTSSTYAFTDIVPGTYTLQATGKKINTTTVQVTIVRGDLNQTYPLTVGLGVNTASGTVYAVQGAGTGDTVMAGATVCVLDSLTTTKGDPADCTSAAAGTDTKAMTTTTASNGTFSIRTVPDGDYYLRVEKTGYLPWAQTDPTTYLHSTASPKPVDVTLTRVTHNVTVQVSAPGSGDLTGFAASLTAVGTTYPNADRTGLSVTSSAVSDSSVPFGCWQLELTDLKTKGHFGSLTMTTPKATECPDGGFWVPTDAGSSTVTADYALAEQPLSFTIKAEPLSPDDALTAADITVADSGGTTVTTYTGWTLSNGAKTLYVAADTYTVTAKAAAPATSTTWPSASADVTVTKDAGASGTVTMVEAKASMSVQLTGVTPAAPQTLTIAFSNGSAPSGFKPIKVTDTTTQPISFTDLPPGVWTITSTDSTGTATVDVTLVGGKDGDQGDGKVITLPAPAPVAP